MTKIFVLCWGVILGTNTYAQVKMSGYDQYNKMIDSLLIVFGQNIEKDISLDGINIPKRTAENFQIVGYNIILEVFFTPKCSYILTLYATSDAMIKKYFKQNKGIHFRKRAYFETFRRDIQNDNKLPYDIIYCFTYKFITPYHDSPKNHAIYGEYKFKIHDDEIVEIVEKKIEILQDQDAILRKYRTTF